MARAPSWRALVESGRSVEPNQGRRRSALRRTLIPLSLARLPRTRLTRPLGWRSQRASPNPGRTRSFASSWHPVGSTAEPWRPATQLPNRPISAPAFAPSKPARPPLHGRWACLARSAFRRAVGGLIAFCLPSDQFGPATTTQLRTATPGRLSSKRAWRHRAVQYCTGKNSTNSRP